MSISEKHIVVHIQSSKRIYDYLPGKFKTISTRKGIKKAFSRKQIYLNGKIASSANYIKKNDEITLIIDECTPPKPYLKKIELLFEDDYLAAFCKPPGLVVSGNQWKTLENAAYSILSPSLSENRIPKPLACHRIDAMTGGIVVFAKTFEARRLIGELFEKRNIQKTYLALVHGQITETSRIDKDINGKKASTLLTVVNIKIIDNQTVSLLKCFPTTGRKHQIRIHLSGNGNPIVGDKIYGYESLNMDKKAMYLFSYEIQFIHPITHESIKIKARPPKKMRRFMEDESL